MKKLIYSSIALILFAGCATHASKPKTTTAPQIVQPVPTVAISRTLAEPSQPPIKKVRTVELKKEVATNTSSKPSPRNEVEPAGTEAVLIASDLGSQINLRTTPEITGKYLGYGVQGDRVQVIEHAAVAQHTWYKVRFPKSGAIGWIRGDFVRVASDQLSSPDPSPSSEETFDTTTSYIPSVATSGGRCNSPSDLDARGHRCGRRAASVRRRR